MSTARFIVTGGDTGRVHADDVTRSQAAGWLRGYAQDCPGRDLLAELAALDVGERLRTHDDSRGIVVRRIIDDERD